jgi:[acyl-carrier-protein] S-malonyltransferase
MTDTQQYIILCPGQGAQHVGMGKAWAEQSPAARQVFETADRVLGVALSEACFNGPAETINRTDYAQAGILATSVASLDAARAGELLTGAPDGIIATAGLSLGEYTALHVAGCLSFEDAIRLVWQRGTFMQEAAEASDGGMVALIGADEEQTIALCDKARGGDVLVPANFNCPGQVVISGSKSACDRALTVAEEMGLRATALTVAGAFHSPLMQPAADRMAEALDKVTFAGPRIPVLSNVTGEAHGSDVEAIKKLLVDQITHPVRWEADVRWLLASDVASGSQMIELGPGKVLGGLMRRIDRPTKVKNIAEPV